MTRDQHLEKFLTNAKKFKRVPVFQEIPVADLCANFSPINLFEHLKSIHPEAVFLENLAEEKNNNYSLFAFDIIANFRSNHSNNYQDKDTSPFLALRQMLSDLSCAPCESNDFNGSIIGYMHYDAVRFFENIPDRHGSIENSRVPQSQMSFNFYRYTLSFKNQKLLIHYIADIRPEEHQENHEKIYYTAQEKIAELINLIKKLLESSKQVGEKLFAPTDAAINCEINDHGFIKMIKRAKEYIQAGDIFQVVLSRAFKKKYTVEPFEIYRVLREKNPTPYLFYLPIENSIMMGASPEKLVSVQNNEIQVNPIAGTRQRLNKNHDEAIEKDLLSDEKELAEHRMLVDLARNDVGSVAIPGSIQVTELLKVKHFSHVSHITSTVIGQLRPNYDIFDALAAAFPAGTLSGAPKIRAMEIIDELETSRRGLYGGAIVRFDYQGNLDSCIAIRMAVLKDGKATVRAGAGIVFDSNPQAEADETRHKAHAMLSAITIAEERKS